MKLLLKSLLCLCLFVLHSEAQENPFDIVRSNSDSTAIAPVDIRQDDDVQTKIEGDNPFSVTHIPIRQNQEQEIAQLKTIPSQADKSIDINYLPLWLGILSLILLALQLIVRRDHILLVIRTIFNNNLMRLTAYENNNGWSTAYLLGYLLFLLNLALLLFYNLQPQMAGTTVGIYFALLGAVALFFLGKHLLLSLFALLFEFTKHSAVYSFTILSFYNLMAVILVCLNLILVFGPASWVRIFTVIAVVIFIIITLSRHYKGIVIARKYVDQHFFHFFLYFCAFEISPWIVLYSLSRGFI